MGKRHSQLGRDHLRGIQGGLCHSFVGIEHETCSAYTGEILGESLLALLLRGIDTILGTANGHIMVQGRILELLKGEETLPLPRPDYLC